jgi:hypothetical protein
MMPMMAHPRHFFASAIDAEPRHNQMVLLPSLKATISTGTVVVARAEPKDGDGDGSDESWIGRIITVKEKFADVPREQREFISELEQSGLHFVQLQLFKFADNLLSFRRCASTDTRVRHVNEITTSLQFVWVASSMVIGLAFLFSHEEIRASCITIQGMERAYLLRYDFEGKEIHEASIFRFPDDYDDYGGSQSYASRMWRAIVLLQLELRRAMNTAKVSTGLFGRVRRTFNMNREEWDFLTYCLKIDVSVPQQNRKRYFHCPEPFLRTKKRAMILEVKQLEFNSEQDFERLNSLLGEACTIGARSHRPKARDNTGQSLRVNDTFNVITIGDNNQPSLLLSFDGYWVDLSLSYQMFQTNSLQSDSWCKGVKRLLAFLKGSMLGMVEQDNNMQASLDGFEGEEHMIIGAPFDHRGHSFTVTAIEGAAGTVTAINDSTGATIELGYEFASLAIKMKLRID